MKKSELFKNLYIFLVFLFLFLPIFVIILFSFNTSSLNIVFEGFTLDWYKELVTNDSLLDALKSTLFVAFVSTLISTLIGTLSAISLKKYNFPLKKLVMRCLYVPIVIPEIVLGIALLSTYSFFKFNLGIWTIILSHIAFSIPFVVVSVKSSLDMLDNDLFDAASDLGASNLKTIFYVIIPSVKTGISSGALLALTLSFDDVVISYFTSGPGSNTLPLYLYSIIKSGVKPDVNALATLMIIFILLIISIYILINYKRQVKNSQ